MDVVDTWNIKNGVFNIVGYILLYKHTQVHNLLYPTTSHTAGQYLHNFHQIWTEVSGSPGVSKVKIAFPAPGKQSGSGSK